MKNKLLAALAAVLAFTFALPPPLHAQTPTYVYTTDKVIRGETAGRFNSAVSVDVAMLVKYVGTAASTNTVAVAANGDLTLNSGGAVDPTIKCPSGGSDGVIDVSDTACDTLGEVADIINASANWKAVILDGLRSDSSNDTIVTFAATNASLTGGLELKWDAAVAFKSTIAIVPRAMRKIEPYLTGGPGRTRLLTSPFTGTRGLVMKSIATSTYGSGTSTFELHSVDVAYAATTGKGSELVDQIWSEAGGATTVAKTFDFTGFGFFGNKDEKLVARLNNSAAMSAVTFVEYGIYFLYR